MERMQVYLTKEQKETLQRLSEEQESSVAELIRTAVERQFRMTDLSTVHETLRDSFGLRTDRSESTEQDPRAFRDEWSERDQDFKSDS